MGFTYITAIKVINWKPIYFNYINILQIVLQLPKLYYYVIKKPQMKK